MGRKVRGQKTKGGERREGLFTGGSEWIPQTSLFGRGKSVSVRLFSLSLFMFHVRYRRLFAVYTVYMYKYIRLAERLAS